jgi:hypothetical protein
MEQETGIIIVAALGGLAIFYFIIEAAVKSGTKDLLKELQKQNQKEPVN